MSRGPTRRQVLQSAVIAGLASTGLFAAANVVRRGPAARPVAGTEHWVPLGPTGGYFTRFDRAGGSPLYAGSDDSGGVWTFNSASGTWQRADTLTNLTAFHVHVSRNNPSRVYATDLYGRAPVVRGVSGTWSEISNAGLAGQARVAGPIWEADANTVYIGTGDFSEPGDGVWQGVLSGGSWTWSRVGPASGVGSLTNMEVFGLVMAGGVLFAGVFSHQCRSGPHGGPGIYAFDGTNWVKQTFSTRPELNNRPVTSMQLGVGGEMLIGYNFAGDPPLPVAYRWRYTSDPEPLGNQTGPWLQFALPWSLISGPSQNGKLVYYLSYVSPTAGGVFRIVEGTPWTWTALTGLPQAPSGGAPAPLGLGVDSSGRVHAGNFSNAGIYRTASATGTSFSALNAGLVATEVNSVAVRPDNGWIIAALLGNYKIFPLAHYHGVLVSKDGGATWSHPGSTTPNPVPVHGIAVAVDPDNNQRTLLGTFQEGIWLSTDGNTHMQFAQQSGIPATATVVAVMFIPGGGAVASVIEHGTRVEPTCSDHEPEQVNDVYSLWYSADGTSWSRSNRDGSTWNSQFLAAQFAVGVSPNPGSQPVRIWAAGVNRQSGSPHGLLYSDDRGQSWIVAHTAVPSAGCVLPDTANANHVFAGSWDRANNKHWFWSVTVGGSASSMPVLPAAEEPVVGDFTSLIFHNGRFIAGFSGAESRVHTPGNTIGSRKGGVYEWDGTASAWSPLETGLRCTHVRGPMAIHPVSGNGRPIAPTYGGGVVKLVAS